ncbi:MAG: glycosyltransferase family 4 protein [Gemmatimonadota bacterium]|nr:glycosyltransferase family 4 protein [Gemmatimonadota bacterium]
MSAAPSGEAAPGIAVSPSIGVAMLCHPYHRGGVTRWMIDAAEGWRRRGSPVWFLAPRPRRPFIGGAGRPAMMDLLHAVPGDVRPALIAPLVGWEFELGTSSYRRHVYEEGVLREVPAGVPLIVSDDPTVWAAAARCALRNPMIGVLHADDQAYYELARTHSRSTSALVAVSRRIAGRVTRELPVDSRPKLATIPCGVPLTVPTPRTPPVPGLLRLLAVGRLDEYQKRAPDLIRVAIALRQRGIAFTLDIVGDGPERQHLASMIAGGDLEEAVSLRGWQSAEEVARALGAADLLLMTSSFEGMSVAVMEAFKSGCGVVSSRVSGVEDYESHPLASDCLRIFPVGEVEAAATCVVDAARVEVHRRVSAARRLAEQEFSLTTCLNRYDDLLHGLTRTDVVRAPSGGQPRWVEASLSLPIASLRATKLRLAKTAALGRRPK